MDLRKIIIILLVAPIWLNSCYNDNEEDLYPCSPQNAGYLVQVEPIINTNCGSCHYGSNPSSGYQFDTYELLRQTVEKSNSQFFCRIKYETGCSVMPPAGKINDCSIAILESWAVSGFPQ